MGDTKIHNSGEALERAREILSGLYQELGVEGRQLVVRLNAPELTQAALKLRDDDVLSGKFLSLVSGVDYLDHMDAVYLLRSLKHPVPMEIRVRLDRSEPTVPTVSGIWSTADWHERETYDLLGIVFAGHPDLRRILTREDFEIFPCRKDAEPRRVARAEWQWPGLKAPVRLPGEPHHSQRS